MRTHKVEQLVIATVGFFWCFLMWFSTAAFSPSIAAHYHLSLKALGLLASSAIWMAPLGRILAGWASDRFGAPRTFAVILAGCGLVSIASAFTENYTLLFAERVIVAVAGVSFVVGIQHVAQWFNANEIGTAEGLYAGTGNVGAGMGALVLPRLFGTNYHAAFLWLGIIALVVAAWYLLRGRAAKSSRTARDGAPAQRPAQHGLCLEPLYRRGADARLCDVIRSRDCDERVAAGLFHARFPCRDPGARFQQRCRTANRRRHFRRCRNFFAPPLFRPFAGFMSDLFQRKGWTPLPFIAKSLPYAPRLHWLGIALILIAMAMGGLAFAGLSGSLHLSVAMLVALGIFISFGTGGTFALVPLLFPDRPGAAAGFVGGVSTAAGIVYPLVFVAGANIHIGYLYVALYLFVPIILFYFWAARYERHPEEHGIFTSALAVEKA